MRVGFGKFAQHNIESVPIPYLCWLAKPSRYYKSQHSPEVTFKVPILVQMEARKVLDQRGFRIIGNRIENRDGYVVYEKR